MNCPNCQRNNPADAQYCIYCATRLAPEVEVKDAPATGATRRLDPMPAYTMPQAAPIAPAPAPMPAPRQYNKELGGGMFLIGLGVLFLTGTFWPGILALIGITAYVNETARGRHREAAQGLIFFVGLSILFWSGWFFPGILILFGLMALMHRGGRHGKQGWSC